MYHRKYSEAQEVIEGRITLEMTLARVKISKIKRQAKATVVAKDRLNRQRKK